MWHEQPDDEPGSASRWVSSIWSAPSGLPVPRHERQGRSAPCFWGAGNKQRHTLTFSGQAGRAVEPGRWRGLDIATLLTAYRHDSPKRQCGPRACHGRRHHIARHHRCEGRVRAPRSQREQAARLWRSQRLSQRHFRSPRLRPLAARGRRSLTVLPRSLARCDRR